MSGYGPVGRKDVSHFDRTQQDLIADMTAMGWIGRVTRNGHAVMRAPDNNETMITVSRQSGRNRAGENQRADFERWKRGTERAAETKREMAEALGEVFCPECGKQYPTQRALGAHRRSHRITVKTCPDCGREVKYLESHRLRSHGVNAKADPVESLLAVLAENENLRAENKELRARRGR